MKITFLGTGAADWVFDLHKDMKDFRRNSSALIDDTLLIDPGPDVIDALNTFGKDANEIKYIINTHRHSDHYCEKTLEALSGAAFIGFEDGDEKKVGTYLIKAFKANHGTCEGAVHFIIDDGEKKLFYGLDSAWLTYEEVGAINSLKIDYAVLDATIGDISGDYRIFEHNNLTMVREIAATLRGSVKKFCISHMARTLHTDHKTLSENMEKCGIDTAYDGMEIVI